MIELRFFPVRNLARKLKEVKLLLKELKREKRNKCCYVKKHRKIAAMFPM